jgi:hypothetical protein
VRLAIVARIRSDRSLLSARRSRHPRALHALRLRHRRCRSCLCGVGSDGSCGSPRSRSTRALEDDVKGPHPTIRCLPHRWQGLRRSRTATPRAVGNPVRSPRTRRCRGAVRARRAPPRHARPCGCRPRQRRAVVRSRDLSSLWCRLFRLMMGGGRHQPGGWTGQRAGLMRRRLFGHTFARPVACQSQELCSSGRRVSSWTRKRSGRSVGQTR